MKKITYASIFIVLALAASGCRKSNQSPSTDIAVSSPYIAAVVRDLLGLDEPIFSLGSPGKCPGHFDIAPYQVAVLSRCRIFLRFEFQKHFDSKLQQITERGLKIVGLPIPPGLCKPDSYLAGCNAVAEALIRIGKLDRNNADVQLKKIEARLNKLALRLHAEIKSAGLVNCPVLAGNHQSDFCSWLKLDVAGTFTSNDDPAQLSQAVRLGRENHIRLIVGNIPEGRVVPARLAEILGGKIVMLSNFPSSATQKNVFDMMLQSNVAEIVKTQNQ